SLDRILAAFDVRIVGREQEDVFAGIADHLADILAGERRELHMFAYDLGWSARQCTDAWIGLLEHPMAVVETAEEIRYPAAAEFDHAAAQCREAREDAMEGDRRQEHLRREVHHHVVEDAQVLAAAQPIGGTRLAIVLVFATQRTRAGADMEHEGKIVLDHRLPDDIEIRMTR